MAFVIAFRTKFPAESFVATRLPVRAPLKVTVAVLVLTGLFGVQPGPLVQVTVPIVVLLVTVGIETTGPASMLTVCVVEFALLPAVL